VVKGALTELQANVDFWVEKYNKFRLHSGRFCYGKKPFKSFQDAKHITIEKNLGNLCETSDSSTWLTIPG
jgi:hypothetical protein